MDSCDTRYERSFFVLQGLVGGLFALIGLVSGMFIPLPPPLKLLIAVGPTMTWAVLMLREHRRGVRRVDETGVTRRDGRHFPWAEFQAVKSAHVILMDGRPGAVNHVDLLFTKGRARILPLVLENGYEAIALVERFQKNRSMTPATTPATQPASPGLLGASANAQVRCSTCGDLKQYHQGSQKHAHEEDDTFLPEAVKKLKFVRDLRPGQNRSPELLQCAECGACFVYEVGYEYLATGSEDTQDLTRVTEEEISKWSSQPE